MSIEYFHWFGIVFFHVRACRYLRRSSLTLPPIENKSKRRSSVRWMFYLTLLLSTCVGCAFAWFLPKCPSVRQGLPRVIKIMCDWSSKPKSTSCITKKLMSNKKRHRGYCSMDETTPTPKHANIKPSVHFWENGAEHRDSRYGWPPWSAAEYWKPLGAIYQSSLSCRTSFLPSTHFLHNPPKGHELM